MAESPDPWEKAAPVRARPAKARSASRSRLRSDRGASVATTIMIEPSARSASIS